MQHIYNSSDNVIKAPVPPLRYDAPILLTDPLEKFRYEMKHREALIINIVDTPDPKKRRDGSDKDAKSLMKTLQTLGYTVHIKRNLTSEKIVDKVVEYAKKNKKCDSFICCILTHGNRGVISGSDGQLVKIEDISKELNTVAHLRDKPKMFFFQACQGDDVKEPKPVPKPESTLDSASAKPVEIDMEVLKLPPDSDFFYGFASSFGTPAMRDRDKGALYINALCRVIESKYKEEDLLTMVTRVHYLVADESRLVRKGDTPLVSYQQQPQLVSTLRKIVQFA